MITIAPGAISPAGATTPAADGRAARWVQSTFTASTAPPSARTAAAMSYGPSGQVVLFGGVGTSGTLGDTWTWDGTEWSQHVVPGPPARWGAAMAYDALNNRTVLFGGVNAFGADLGDTWTWDGATWTSQSTFMPPMPRHGASMTTTPSGVVLFGGTSSVMTFDDTWVFTGNWLQVSTPSRPLPRSTAAMTWDRTANRLVLFGGRDGLGLDFGDTWQLQINASGPSSWVQATPSSSPSTREGTTMAFDAATNEVVLFGGNQSTTFDPTTWVWTAGNWVARPPIGPAPTGRRTPGMVWDDAANHIVMFGGSVGNTPLGDTWTWVIPDGSTARDVTCSGQVPTGVTPQGVPIFTAVALHVALVVDITRPQVVPYGTTANVGNVAVTIGPFTAGMHDQLPFGMAAALSAANATPASQALASGATVVPVQGVDYWRFSVPGLHGFSLTAPTVSWQLTGVTLSTGGAGLFPFDVRLSCAPDNGDDIVATTKVDKVPFVSVGDASIVEGDSGNVRIMTFPVTLSEPSPTTVNVGYAISEDTGPNAALPAYDFDLVSGMLQFVPGLSGKTPTTKFISVKVNPDTVVEANETVRARLIGVDAGYTLGTGGFGRSVGLGTIIDDDASAGGNRVSIGSGSIVEGDSTASGSGFHLTKVIVGLSAPAAAPGTVTVTVGGGSATEETDFKGYTKVLTFSPGQYQRVVGITVRADFVAEDNDTVNVSLSDPTGGLALGLQDGTVTIINDD